MQNKEYLIDIIGQQVYPERPNETEKTTLRTTGTYTQRGGARFIAYKEYDSENPKVSRNTVLKIEPTRVTMIRPGLSTRLIMELETRNLCAYDTGYGTLAIGVYTSELHNALDEDGGTLRIKYTLEIDSNLASTNELEVRVKPC